MIQLTNATVGSEKSFEVLNKIPENIQELKLRAYQLKTTGSNYTSIGDELGITPDTARDWVLEINQTIRKKLENVAAVDVVTESLVYFDSMETTFLSAAVSILEAGQEVNERGQTVQRARGRSSRYTLYLKYLRAAMDARKEKIALMSQCGILPKTADQLYKNWKGVSEEVEVADDDPTRERTPEELRKDIERLLANNNPLA